MSSKNKSNPRKFAEKIALLNKKEAEATAEFEKIIKEVEETTRVSPVPPYIQGLSPQYQGLDYWPILPTRSSSFSNWDTSSEDHHYYSSPQNQNQFSHHRNPANRTQHHHHQTQQHQQQQQQPFYHGPSQHQQQVNRYQTSQGHQQIVHSQAPPIIQTALDDFSVQGNGLRVPNIAIYTEDEFEYSPVNQTNFRGHQIHGHAQNNTTVTNNGFLRNDCSPTPISSARSLPNIANLAFASSQTGLVGGHVPAFPQHQNPGPRQPTQPYNQQMAHQHQQQQLSQSHHEPDQDQLHQSIEYNQANVAQLNQQQMSPNQQTQLLVQAQLNDSSSQSTNLHVPNIAIFPIDDDFNYQQAGSLGSPTNQMDSIKHQDHQQIDSLCQTNNIATNDGHIRNEGPPPSISSARSLPNIANLSVAGSPNCHTGLSPGLSQMTLEPLVLGCGSNSANELSTPVTRDSTTNGTSTLITSGNVMQDHQFNGSIYEDTNSSYMSDHQHSPHEFMSLPIHPYGGLDQHLDLQIQPAHHHLHPPSPENC